MSTKIDYNTIRKRLEDEKAEVSKHLENLSGPHLHMNPDRDDLAQDYITLEKNEALRALDHEQLSQIESALERLDNNSYGLCSNCGEQIPLERLEILPYATLCVACQSEKEHRW